MIMQTLFARVHGYEIGQVEVRLLPGLPMVHVVGLPDAHIRECGIRLKSALKSLGFKWPAGHQIVVNLRPAHLRKHGPGTELAIALGFLAATGQLPAGLVASLKDKVIYGELGLDGRVYAPGDLVRALAAVSGGSLVSGQSGTETQDGLWWQMARLDAEALSLVERRMDWSARFRPPELPTLDLHPSAAWTLRLVALQGLSALVVGPQGSGKTTWARLVHALSAPPDPGEMLERARLFPDTDVMDEGAWRPLLQPHHTTPPLAMVGGGTPMRPGVISRAHGGVLIMDEFLEFHPRVLESLREPVESGVIEIARAGQRARYPARFQLLATSNLCPCGLLYPDRLQGCSRSLTVCRSVCRRLSGPLLDRFDIVVFSHKWLRHQTRVPLHQVRDELDAARDFRGRRGPRPARLDAGQLELGLSHRRHQSLLRVARALADLEGALDVTDRHLDRAQKWAVQPMFELRQLFA